VKKIILLAVLLFSFFCLSSCGKNSDDLYREAYDTGYWEGYEQAIMDADRSFDEGFNVGRESLFDEGDYLAAIEEEIFDLIDDIAYWDVEYRIDVIEEVYEMCGDRINEEQAEALKDLVSWAYNANEFAIAIDNSIIKD